MSFEATRFSEAGLQLLAQLSTSKTLKIKHVYVDSVEHDIIDLEQPPSWWANTTTATMAQVSPEVILAGAKDTQARLRIKLSLKSGVTETKTIKTIVICACAVESGAEGVEMTFCGVIDPVGVEVIYHSGSSIKTSTGVSIYFKFSNTSSITVETLENPDLVLQSDLDRYLTCHKVSDPYNGEDQQIHGNKFFTNLVLSMYNGIAFGESPVDVYGKIVFSDEYFVFTESVNGSQGSVTPIYKFKNNDIDIIKIDLDRTGNESLYTTTFKGIISADEVFANVLNSEDVYIRIASDLIPKEGGNGHSIGTENNYFNNIYSNNFIGETLKSSIQTDSDRIETVLADGLTFNEYVGNAKNWWANIKYNNVSGPGAALTISVKDVNCIVVNENYSTFYNDIIAKRSIKFDSGIILYEDEAGLTVAPGTGGMFIQGQLTVQGKINGRLPATDLDTTPRIPIGATVCLSGLSANLGVGAIVSGTYSLCGLTGETDPQNHKTKSDEEYQLLTSTSATVTYALAMRIS